MRTAAIMILWGASTFAQSNPALNGSYFFEEQGAQAQAGQPFRAVGLIQLDGKGNANGTELVRQANQVVSRAVSGEYQFGADGMGSMVLRYTVADDDGNNQTMAANYRMVMAADGQMSLLRNDNGVLADGALTPAATAAAALKGSYVVTEQTQGTQATLTLGVWSFDGTGNVAVRALTRGFYQSSELSLGGRLEAQADGTFNLRVATAAARTDDGDMVDPTVMNYKVVPAGKSFELLRLDDGIFAETTVSAK